MPECSWGRLLGALGNLRRLWPSILFRTWTSIQPDGEEQHLHDATKNPGEVSDLPCTKQGSVLSVLGSSDPIASTPLGKLFSHPYPTQGFFLLKILTLTTLLLQRLRPGSARKGTGLDPDLHIRYPNLTSPITPTTTHHHHQPLLTPALHGALLISENRCNQR